MEVTKIVRNPLERRPLTSEEVLKKKEQFGERIVEKERMKVLRELIERNERTDRAEGYHGEEAEYVYPTPTSSPSPILQKSQLSHTTTLTTASSPDLEFYYNDRKSNDKFLHVVPQLDLSWLDNEDETRKDTDSERKVSACNGSSSRIEHLDEAQSAKSSTIIRKKSKVTASKNPMQKIRFFSSSDSSCLEINRNEINKRLDSVFPEVQEGLVEYDTREKVVTSQPSASSKGLGIEQSSRIDELKNRQASDDDTDSETETKENVTPDDKQDGKQEKPDDKNSQHSKISFVKPDEAEKIYSKTTNYSFLKPDETDRNKLQSSKKASLKDNEVDKITSQNSKSPVISKPQKEKEKVCLDVACQVEWLEEAQQENRNFNSTQRDSAPKPGDQSRRSYLKIADAIDSKEVGLMGGPIVELKEKAEKEMVEMEEWKGEIKKKHSMARCYCFLCGLNCGLWFC